MKQFSKALRSLTANVGLLSDSEILEMWSEVSRDGKLSAHEFKTLYSNLSTRFKRRVRNGISTNVSEYNEYCNGNQNPFDMLKGEGQQVDVDSIASLLSGMGEKMPTTEFYEILTSCPGVEDHLRDGEFDKAVSLLKILIAKKIPVEGME